MSMIAICRDCKQVVSKAADILIQLYQSNQPSEVNLINQSLTTLLNLDIEKFLTSFFANFEDGSELVRERSIKFLASKLHTVSDNALTKDIEEQLMSYAKKAMEDVTKDEFISFIGILSKLKIAKTSSGQATIVSAIKSQAELNKDFDVNDKDTLEKFLLCTKQTIPLLSQYNRASEYVNYICLKMIPKLKQLAEMGHDLTVLQALAEMSPHVMIDDVPSILDLDQCHKIIYEKLMEYLPDPDEVAAAPAPKQEQAAVNGEKKLEATVEAPAAAEGEQPKEESKEDSSENQATAKVDAKPDTKKSKKDGDFQFTHIEYLMYTYVQLSRLKPELYTETMKAESRKRLSHLANGCKKYIDALEGQMSRVKKQDLNNEENKLRSVALRTTKNISAMIVGLFRKPSDFKAPIVLSCKPQIVPQNNKPSKRRADDAHWNSGNKGEERTTKKIK